MLERVDLNAFFADQEVYLRDLLHGSVKLTMALTPQRPWVMGDRPFLKRAFANLMTNARSAVEKVENPQVLVVTRVEGNSVIITVSDNGSGMDDEQLAKIKAAESFTTKLGHTGLGFGVVMQVFQHHNGRVEVQSEIGTGTTFGIVLPLA